MRKKSLSLLFAILLLIAVFPIKTFASPGDVHQVTSWPDGKAKLLGGAPEWVFFKQGNSTSNGIAAIWTPEELDGAAKEQYFAKVKASDSSIGNITSSSMVSFFYGSQIVTNSNNNTGKYQVGAIDGVWYVFVSGGLSHFYYSEGKPPADPLVKTEVTADVIENFRKIALQDQYKQDVQDFYKYNVQDFYKYDVQDFYKYDVQDFYKYDSQDFYKYDVQSFYERDAQKVYIPAFEKKAVKAGTDTLVTWRNNNAVPGGTFGNGMTYLEINAEKARNEGYTFGIADSSPSNKYVGYDYHVRIDGIDLVISFDDRFISASVSAKVYSAAPEKHDPSGHQLLRTGDELRIPLPAPVVNDKVAAASAAAAKNGNNVTITVIDGSKTFTNVVEFAKNVTKNYTFNGYTVEVAYNGNGVKSAKVVSQPVAAPSDHSATADKYYLFFHIENGVNFYETPDYHFVGWNLAETKFGEYGLVDTVTGDPYYVNTVTGQPYFANTVTGDPYLVNTVTGDPYFVETVTGDPYLANTVTGDPYLVAKDVEIGNEAGTRPYTGTLKLTVDGVEQPLDEAFYLKPGEHEFALRFAGRTVTENWVVASNADNEFAFETQYIDGSDEISKAADLVLENKLEDVTTENKLADVTTENKLGDVTTENKLEDVTTENKLDDVKTENKLSDVTTDKWLSDAYLGSEDPKDPGSIQYGIYTPAKS